MIITLSASQGQGKTTLLNELKKYNYDIINNTTSREILSDMNKTLNDVYSVPAIAEDFQNKILDRQEKYNDAMLRIKRPIITERSFADIFTYAMFAYGNINDYSTSIDSYYHKCKRLQNEQYACVVYLSGRQYVPDNDGVRSTNQYFSKLVDKTINYYIDDFYATCPEKIYHIDTPNLDERVEKMIEIINEVKNNKNGK
jgi:predicted ATPase